MCIKQHLPCEQYQMSRTPLRGHPPRLPALLASIAPSTCALKRDTIAPRNGICDACSKQQAASRKQQAASSKQQTAIYVMCIHTHLPWQAHTDDIQWTHQWTHSELPGLRQPSFNLRRLRLHRHAGMKRKYAACYENMFEETTGPEQAPAHMETYARNVN